MTFNEANEAIRTALETNTLDLPLSEFKIKTATYICYRCVNRRICLAWQWFYDNIEKCRFHEKVNMSPSSRMTTDVTASPKTEGEDKT